jgi:hypothetical protein
LGAQSVNTTTTLTVQPGPSATCPASGLTVTLTSATVVVTANAGMAAGSVSIVDGAGSSAVQLASAALDPSGQASFVFYLNDGPHSLSAVYAGDTTFDGSTSVPASLDISSQCSSQFVVSVSNLSGSSTSATTLTLTPGQTGTGIATVTPLQTYVSTLTAPVFITISCSGLPDLANCAFTPENVEILPSEYAGVTSSMVIQTYAASTTFLSPASRPGESSRPIAWAFLLPGALCLGGLTWGARRRRGPHGQVFVRGVGRRWLRRLSLLTLLGLVTLLGTTGCNPRYGYKNHGPQPNPATPAGTYTVSVAAQSSNGLTAELSTTTFALTVK